MHADIRPRHRPLRAPIVAFLDVLLSLILLSTSGSAQQLSVAPLDGLLDAPLAIRASGLSPNQPVIVRATAEDGHGISWLAHAGFYADAQGVVDLERDAPANGDYQGVQPMGLVWFMNVPLDQRGQGFASFGARPVTMRFALEVDGNEVQSVEVTRRYAAQGVTSQDVHEDGLYGKLFVPAGPSPHPGMVVLGGSEGGLSSDGEAALLASHGYAALALAYFGVEGLPEELAEIPLEYFERAIRWLGARPEVEAQQIGIMGGSKGAEAALLVASRSPEVRAVVAYKPSSVAWSCICDNRSRSSWSAGGAPVPFVPYSDDPTYQPPPNFPIRAAVRYAYRLAKGNGVTAASIPVEKIRGPVLLVSGKDDQLWPSADMAEMVMARRARAKHPHADIHLSYEDAGHAIRTVFLPVAGSTTAAGGRLVLGGTDAGNARAQASSWPRVLAFLGRALAPR